MSVTHKTTGTGTKVNDIVWTEEHRVTWTSPGEDYLPISCRMDQKGLVYYDDPYLVIRVMTDPNHYISWLAYGKTFGYGSYEWKGKVANAVNYTTLFLGLFEHRHGWANEGAIFLKCADGTWSFQTYKTDGTQESTTITGVDFTIERTFRVEWVASSVKLYIDDVLKATHSTAVPQVEMQLFSEVITGASAPSAEPTVFFRAGSFKKL